MEHIEWQCDAVMVDGVDVVVGSVVYIKQKNLGLEIGLRQLHSML